MSCARSTSVEAYHYLVDTGVLSRRRREVYKALYHHGPVTGNELWRAMGVPWGHQTLQPAVPTRLCELREMGLVQELDPRTCAVTGMSVIVWDVTDRIHPLPRSPKSGRLKAALRAMREMADEFDRLGHHGHAAAARAEADEIAGRTGR